MKRRKVEAWTLIADDGTRVAASFESQDFGFVDQTERVVRLTPVDPLQRQKDAVVRAAVKLVAERLETNGDALVAAVERLQRKGRKK